MNETEIKSLSPRDRIKLNKLESIFKSITAIDESMPLGQVRFLIAVAKNEGKCLKDITTECGMLVGTSSRYLANLMFIPKYRQNAGVALVRAYESPIDRRQKIIVLTPAGKKLVERLIESS